jgi:RNA polymerase sigma factor (sigma-70 family)
MTRKDRSVLRPLDTLFNVGATRGLSDGQLLERFSTGHGEAAELAFAALVERHGAMVLRVCRARLGNGHDAMDAFQATFIVLVKRARALWVQESLGPWLHQVAHRTASCARITAARRQRLERQVAEAAGGREEDASRLPPEWEQVLHDEINRLPERYRVPIVLCDLEGHSCEEAARRMGRPVGTIKCWRSRGRERLRVRLSRAGLGASAGLAAALGGGAAHAAVPPSLSEATVWTAARVIAGRTSAGAVPAAVSALASTVLKEMLVNKSWMTIASVLALAFMAAGIGAAAQKTETHDVKSHGEAPGVGPAASVAKRMPPPTPLEGELWKLSLREALRIGLNNAETIRLLDADALVIEPVNSKADPLQFKAEVMAFARSVEQLYWSLVEQHAKLSAAEGATELAEEVHKREQSQLAAGQGRPADVAEATQRLELFRLDVVTRTSSIITTERQLRRVLGLSPADNRRIVPVTAPTEARVEPNWEVSRAAMLDHQPEVVRARSRTKVDEWIRAVASRNPGSEPTRDSGKRSQPSAATPRDTSVQSDDDDDPAKQAIRQAVHSLARFYLEIDANYKQYRSATERRVDTAHNLTVYRDSYEQGQASVVRYLDVIGQWARAAAEVAEFKCAYNVGLIAFEEAKGTLLEYDRIAVRENPRAGNTAIAKHDRAARPASVETSLAATYEAHRGSSLPSPNDDRANSAGVKNDVAGKTFTFRFTVGSGPRPIEFRGAFTVAPTEAVAGEKTP